MNKGGGRGAEGNQDALAGDGGLTGDRTILEGNHIRAGLDARTPPPSPKLEG